MKVMMLSDSPMTVTGYATVTRCVLNGLSKLGHECHHLAHNYIGQTLVPGTKFEDGTTVDYYVHGTGKEPYMKDMIMPKIREYKPDVFITLLDLFMVYPWYLQLDFAPAKTVFYFPSDGGGGLPLGCDQILRKMTMPVAMARFGQRQCKQVHGLDTACIPHAADTNNYYPLSKKKIAMAKQKYNIAGKFVFGTVARNQGRKMLDRTVKAFAVFAKTHPDTVLFFHSDPYDSAAIFPMLDLVKRYNIQNRVVWSGMRAFKGFDYKQMNEVYNLMDCHLLSTSGEGFGCPTVEAMACGVPSIITDYTTSRELVDEDGQSGLLVKLAGTETEENPLVHGNEILNGTLTGSWMVERGVMDIKDCVRQMDRIYTDHKLRARLGKTGVQKVKKLYSWDVVISQWDKLLKGMMDK